MSVLMEAIARRLLRNAQAHTEQLEAPLRAGRYGDLFTLSLFSGYQALAEEGSLFTATNPTPGTGIALGAQSTAFSDTVAVFEFKNNQVASDNAKAIIPLQLRLVLAGTAPTGTVSMHWAIKRSTNDREPTTAANRTVLVPVNTNSAGDASIARVLSYSAAAAMTVPASSTGDPVVSRFTIPTGLGITGDQYVVGFGGVDLGAKPGLTAVRATDVGTMITQAPAFVINPGEWAVVHMWWVTSATNVPNFEFEWIWTER